MFHIVFKVFVCLVLLCLVKTPGHTQTTTLQNSYAPGPEHPFGQRNPDAPPETAQFDFMIGEFSCTDKVRNADGEWEEIEAIWTASYFLNGYGVQDRYWSERNATSNIRIFDPVEKQWNITFFDTSGSPGGVWRGGKEGENMVFRQAQTAPSGTEGVSRLTFSNITDNRFEWVGAFVAGEGTDQEFIFEFWTSSCQKTK